MNKKIYSAIIVLLFIANTYSQDKPALSNERMGVAVSPSSMHLRVRPGNTEVKEIKVLNDTDRKYTFQVGFNDFEMSREGKAVTVNSQESKYALSKWTSVSPTYFELNPGEDINIRMVITIPDEDESYISAWTMITIEQVVERPPLDTEEHPERVAFGITSTFGFGVFIYQNPPNVLVNRLDITNLFFDANANTITMSVENTGDGIGNCTTYLELTNLQTGDQKKLKPRRFTILPQYFRDFVYELGNIPPGKYSAVGVLDYGDKEEIVAAELEFDVKSKNN